MDPTLSAFLQLPFAGGCLALLYVFGRSLLQIHAKMAGSFIRELAREREQRQRGHKDVLQILDTHTDIFQQHGETLGEIRAAVTAGPRLYEPGA